MELDVLSCQAILAITQLDHLVDGVAHCAVILHHHRLHRLDETTLDVTGLGSLDSCVDETLSASHGVEEELCWCQAGQVGVLYKASALRAVIILNEVRQCAVFEAKGDSFTLHVLLPHHSNNLNEE